MQNTKTYYNINGHKLKMTIIDKHDKTIGIIIENLNYDREKVNKFYFIFITFCVYLLLSNIFKVIYVNIFFGILSIYFIYKLFTLVKSEKILLIDDFGLQKTSEFYMNRITNYLIPITYIHEIIINETIINLKVIYMLVVHTKGALFKERPIILLFERTLPNLECVEIIYKLLSLLKSNR